MSERKHADMPCPEKNHGSRAHASSQAGGLAYCAAGSASRLHHLGTVLSQSAANGRQSTDVCRSPSGSGTRRSLAFTLRCFSRSSRLHFSSEWKAARGAKGRQVSSARSRVASWQQSALLDAPGSALRTNSAISKSLDLTSLLSLIVYLIPLSPRSFSQQRAEAEPFSSSSLRRNIIALLRGSRRRLEEFASSVESRGSSPSPFTRIWSTAGFTT